MEDTEAAGRAAGRACSLAGTANVVDALVIVVAALHRAAVFTSDPGDLARIAEAVEIDVQLHRV